MVTIAAVAVCVLLAALAVFQVLLVFGAPLGRFAWGGQHRVLPQAQRVGSGVSVLIYVLIAAVVATRAGMVSIDVPDAVVEVAMWVLVGYFVLGIGLNLASRSTPERLVMSPLCAVLGVLCGIVVLG
jgi:hypothetical protein